MAWPGAAAAVSARVLCPQWADDQGAIRLQLVPAENTNEAAPPPRPQCSYQRGPSPHTPPPQGPPLGEDACTHLSEEMGCPSFCHLGWGAREVSSRQKSRTKCPRATCTREGSEPARLILERWEVRT